MNRISLLTVLVKHQDSAIDFYTRKLGFVAAEDLPFGPKRWVTLRLPDDQSLSLTLNLAESAEDRSIIGKQAGSQPIFARRCIRCLDNEILDFKLDLPPVPPLVDRWAEHR